MKLSGLSEKVFLDRYSLKDASGKPLESNPEEMWLRVAKAVADIEPKDKSVWQQKFYDAMTDFKFVPGGRILAGAGTGYAVTFYNCFVIPSPQDSRGGIIDSLKQMVEIMSRGGGVGINLSSLRPRGYRVKKVNGFSSGPINWAELFSVSTRDIIQQGGTRRGALMEMLWDWHPDIEEFITVKQDLSKLNGANLSVCISDSFMEAVDQDKDWDLVFPDTEDPDYDEVWRGDLKKWKELGKKVNVLKTVKARYIWDLIANAAWKSAEPGVVFMERCQKYYNNWYWNQVNCVNPCGEEPLPPFGVCNLGSINLSAMVKYEDIDKPGIFDWKTLKHTVQVATRFLDNVVDMDPYVFPEIKKTQLEGERRIGLGTMGLGDALIKMHLRYGSEDSLKFIEDVYRMIRDEAYATSIELAVQKAPFAKFDKDLYPQGKFIQNLPSDLQKKIAQYGVRNSLLLMQAPTGSTSLMADTTSGIEPVFEFEFIRKDRIGEHLVRHTLFNQWVEKHEGDGAERPEWFCSAANLIPEDHVKVQGVIQKYVDASISKTVNAPFEHTVEEVKKLYTQAYNLGLKGITYMREGSRAGVLERTDLKDKTEKTEKKEVKHRPAVLQGYTYKTDTPVGDAYLTINNNEDGNPWELFVTVGKPGYDIAGLADALGRMISLVMRLENDVDSREKVRRIISQLSGIGGRRSIGFGHNRVLSLPDAIARMLSDHFGFKIYEKVEAPKEVPKQTASKIKPDICPACGEASMIHEEGCSKCYACGNSLC